MSAVYSEASKLLQHYLNREGGLKTVLFAQQNADNNPSHKKQYKLVAETLRCQQPASQPASQTDRTTNLPLTNRHNSTLSRTASLLCSAPSAP